MTNFCLHDGQTVNRLRKITWASIFRFLFETVAYKYNYKYKYKSKNKYIYTHTHTHKCAHTHTHTTTELTENGNFRLFAVNGKQQTSLCLLQRETENGGLFSLVGKR
jgi:hypothetical protein